MSALAARALPLALLLLAAAPAGAAECAIGVREKVVVRLEPPRGIRVAGAVLSLRYAADEVVVPGRERDLPAGTVVAVPEGMLLAARDLDGELRLVVAEGDGLPAGPLVRVELGRCAGASAGALEIGCRVEDASDTKSTRVDGVACRVGAD